MPQRERQRPRGPPGMGRRRRARRRQGRRARRSSGGSVRRRSVGEGALFRLRRVWSPTPGVGSRELSSETEPRRRNTRTGALARGSPRGGAPHPFGCSAEDGSEEFRPEGLRWSSDPWSKHERGVGFAVRGMGRVVSARPTDGLRTSPSIAGSWGAGAIAGRAVQPGSEARPNGGKSRTRGRPLFRVPGLLERPDPGCRGPEAGRRGHGVVAAAVNRSAGEARMSAAPPRRGLDPLAPWNLPKAPQLPLVPAAPRPVTP